MAHDFLDGQYNPVSTHSRLKAAVKEVDIVNYLIDVSTHSRLKAAGI